MQLPRVAGSSLKIAGAVQSSQVTSNLVKPQEEITSWGLV
jgi:hypothetical protein